MKTNASTVMVNGEEQELSGALLLAEFLSTIGLRPDAARGVAVALNDEVVRREAWDTTQIRPGDRIEIVTAKQGG